jgi:hypothetical protein
MGHDFRLYSGVPIKFDGAGFWGNGYAIIRLNTIKMWLGK